jgi:PAS domain S-box-containing protein
VQKSRESEVVFREWRRRLTNCFNAQRQLDCFFNASLDLLCIVHIDGRFVRLNPAWEHALGYTRAELMERPFCDCVHPDDRDKARRMAASLADGPGWFVIRHLHKDGSRRSLEWSASRCKEWLYGSARDITARLRAEAQLAANAAELRVANAELDAFAYAVSHDLRAPLRAMMGFSEALRQDYGDSFAGEARMFLDQIDVAGRSMNELIDGLLALSRCTRGELSLQPLDISAMAERLIAEQARAHPDHKPSCCVEPEVSARGDLLMIEVVLRNLIENAWKYTAKTPEPAIRVHTDAVQGRLWLCVSDNGAGFNETFAQKLFKPFQRLHRQEEFPGVGVGLATVQRIVNRHGGVIRAWGAPGKGASFCFTLPNLDAESPAG